MDILVLKAIQVKLGLFGGSIFKNRELFLQSSSYKGMHENKMLDKRFDFKEPHLSLPQIDQSVWYLLGSMGLILTMIEGCSGMSLLV